MNISSDLRQILFRLGVFTGLFILVSGLIGSWLVPTRLLYSFDFYIYGNLGKMVILSVVMLAIMTRERLGQVGWPTWPKIRLDYLVSALLFVPLFFILANILLTYPVFTSYLPLSIVTHGILILIPVLLFLGVFGTEFIKVFFKLFKREIGICLALSVAMDLAIFQVWKLWPLFSSGVLLMVKFLLSLTFSDVLFISPYTLSVNNFAVSILQSCSGLDSLFMFSALYFFIGFVDYKKFNLVRMLAIYPVAAAGMYLVNIFRVYILMIIGAEISSDLALNLFHTYAGMVLFILYFGLFWKLFNYWFKVKHAK